MSDELRNPYQHPTEAMLYGAISGDNEVFTVGTKDGAIYIYSGGVINDLVRYVFTHGYCGLLAIALHRRTGWPIAYSGYEGAHYGVEMPDGRILDINGATEPQNWWFGVRRYVEACELDTKGIRQCGAASFVAPLLEDAMGGDDASSAGLGTSLTCVEGGGQ